MKTKTLFLALAVFIFASAPFTFAGGGYEPEASTTDGGVSLSTGGQDSGIPPTTDEQRAQLAAASESRTKIASGIVLGVLAILVVLGLGVWIARRRREE